MTRVILFLIVVGLIAVGFVWIADQPGDVIITWHGQNYKTTLMVLTVGALVAMAAILLLTTALTASLHLLVREAQQQKRPPEGGRC